MNSWKKEYIKRSKKRYKFFSSSTAQHIFFVDINNDLYGCGQNVYAQLFLRFHGTTNVLSPRKIEELNDVEVSDIQICWMHSVLLPRNSNKVYFSREKEISCTGIVTSNDHIKRNIKEGSKSYSSDYSVITFQEIIIKISISGHFFFVITLLGKVYTNSKKEMKEVTFPAGEEIFDIVSGDSYSFFVSSSGNIFGKGTNTNKQLFLQRAYNCELKKTPLHKINLVKINCGQIHTAVLTKNGSILLSGKNQHKQIGTNCERYELDKRKYNMFNDFDNICLGGFHNIFQRGTGVHTFGFGRYGRLGRKDFSSENSKCLKVFETIGEVHCGRSQSFIVTDKGIRCSGYGYYGTCMNGGTKNSSKFEMVQEVIVAKFKYLEYVGFRKKLFSNIKFCDVRIQSK